jgi:hypothetical protein
VELFIALALSTITQDCQSNKTQIFFIFFVCWLTHITCYMHTISKYKNISTFLTYIKFSWPQYMWQTTSWYGMVAWEFSKRDLGYIQESPAKTSNKLYYRLQIKWHQIFLNLQYFSCTYFFSKEKWLPTSETLTWGIPETKEKIKHISKCTLFTRLHTK